MQRLLVPFLSIAALAPAVAHAQPAPDAQPAPAAPGGEPAPAPTDAPATSAPAPIVPAPPVEATPPEAKPTAPAVTSKWDATLYGFVELDAIYDSTQGLNDSAGNAAIARPGSYTGEHGQTTYGARNSRIGFKIAAPTYNSIKATGQLEMDFLGNQPPGISEAAFFQNPTFRYRHLNVKLETPVVDILLGQYWQLFGWQTLAHPNTVEIQGIPGEVYSRAPQIRISKKIKAGDITVEAAVAASRPPQRASATPDGQAGIKLTYEKLTGLRTAGGSGTSIDAASIGVSVVGRKFGANPFLAATPADQLTSVDRNGYGISIDALLPVIPATKAHKDNALTLTGSYVNGAGIADLYTGLSGGVSNPALPSPGGGAPAPTYTANVDNGLVLFKADGTLHPIQWTSYIVGAQYYLPVDGKVWVSGNYSHMSSDNAHAFGDPKKVFDKSDWVDGNLFFDITPAARIGLQLSWAQQAYVDGTDAKNYRAQFSGWLIF
jgi:hypothetical protein